MQAATSIVPNRLVYIVFIKMISTLIVATLASSKPTMGTPMLSIEDRELLTAALDHICAVPVRREAPTSSPAHRKLCDACLVELVRRLSDVMATKPSGLGLKGEGRRSRLAFPLHAWPDHVLLAETTLWRQDRALPPIGAVLCARYHEHG